MATWDHVSTRIARAQEAVNIEIENLAASLGFPAPKTAPENEATTWEALAAHLEMTARALATINEGYAESQAPVETEPVNDSEGAVSSQPRTTVRRQATSGRHRPVLSPIDNDGTDEA